MYTLTRNKCLEFTPTKVEYSSKFSKMENDKGTPKLSSGILDLQSIHLVNNLNQRKACVNKDQVL